MQIVVTELLDEVGALFRQSPEIVGSYESAGGEFAQRVHDWLARAEVVLQKHRRPQVSTIAGLRAQLKAAADGAFDLQSIRLPAAAGTRKTHRAAAALLFNQGQTALRGVHEAVAASREEALNYLRQMIVLALQKNTFYPVWNAGADRAQSIVAVWQSLLADADAVTAGRRVLSLVSYPDVLRLIDEVASEWSL